MRFWFSSLRKLPSSTVFYPEHAIPKEALHYVKQYFAAKTKFTAARVTMVPPGRCIYLRRLKGQDRRCWDAVWIKREHIVEEGILLSRHQNSDHYIHRLKNALESAAEHWAEA